MVHLVFLLPELWVLDTFLMDVLILKNVCMPFVIPAMLLALFPKFIAYQYFYNSYTNVSKKSIFHKYIQPVFEPNIWTFEIEKRATMYVVLWTSDI